MDSIDKSQEKALQHIQHKLAALDDIDDDHRDSQAQADVVDQDGVNVVKAAVKETPGDGADRDAQARISKKKSSAWHCQEFPLVYFCLSPLLCGANDLLLYLLVGIFFVCWFFYAVGFFWKTE